MGMGNSKKILLALLPFWDPQIPPLGIACIAGYLKTKGYDVKAVDANLEPGFRETYDEYYKILRKIIPLEKQGNIFNIGNQVLRNHMMAHLNGGNAQRYNELIKIVVMKTFFIDIDNRHIASLNEIITCYYAKLKQYIMNLLEKENPTVFGLSVYCDTLASSMAAFQWVKDKDPSIKTIMGGGIFSDQLAMGSPNLDYFLAYCQKFIDKIIVGEGEELFYKFLQDEFPDSQKVFGLNDIKSQTLDLEHVNIPDFSDFDLRYYPHLAHYTARSCPYQCKFCSETVNWGEYRKKNIPHAVAEFNELFKRYSSQLFLLTDSTLNPVITELSNEFIKSGTVIYWDGFLRADKHVCHMENTMLWRRGGFYRAKLGLESGSQRVLDLMNKKITIEQMKSALVALAQAGIKTTTMWIAGYPGETEEDFRMTLNFLEKNKDSIYEADCNGFYFYPTGQVNSEEWVRQIPYTRLYPEWAKNMLITDTWILDCEPKREEIFNRINRFIEHCLKLGIPNPYSLNDIYKADERWKKLHKNAVPSVIDLQNKKMYITECRNIKELTFAENKLDDGSDWF